MDKLTILNRALVATGNRTITLNDGSDEWQVVEPAFDRAIDDLISQHRWPFARKSAALVMVPGNQSRRFPYAFRLPDDLLHLRRVFYGAAPTGVLAVDDYQVLGRTLATTFNSGVSIEYIAPPPDEEWHPQATEVLTLLMEAACLRGLNEDFNEAARVDQKVEYKLAHVRSLVSSEDPAATISRGRATEARGRRRG